MRTYYTYLLATILYLGTQDLPAQVSISASQLVLENTVMRQVVSFKDATIKPLSIFDKKTGKELLVTENATPWFEFVVNQQLITANDPIWKYKANSIRLLNNGGQEIELLFESIRKLKGLRLKIYRQIFPNSALVRERLVLSAAGKDIQLNKQNGRLHFRFPVYTLKQNFSNAPVEEIRIATFAKEGMEEFNTANTWDDRLLDGVKTFNLANCHMFHPDRKWYPSLAQQNSLMKGPFVFIHSPVGSWFTAYEHASQDKNWKAEKSIKIAALNTIFIDEQQGVSGNTLTNSDSIFWFLGVEVQSTNNSTVVAHQVLRGAYLEGEHFGEQHPYETVWTASGFAADTVLLKQEMHQYLWSYITEHPASRKSHFYYNTWGMQRDNTNTIGLREIYTEQRILTEIKNAAELKVDLFVLDDGWEETMGDWQANTKRLPNGLKPLIDEMKIQGIIPGIWLSPMGIDSLANRFKLNQQWVIKDENGKPIKGQWDFPVFDFVSDFKALFVADCKKLIDQGIRFFKWDAINTFNSSLINLYHGNTQYSPDEIRDRYAYLLPFYVTAAMRELREYNPEVVVEIDLTEKERCMVGLMPLQEGKFFWMNNGASGYNDYSTYRTKSMRTVINKYAGIIPTELFTQAVYPHNPYPFFAQRYHVNTTLVGGHGFWGNLLLMTREQRIRAGKMVVKSKKVLPYISHLPTEVTDLVGAAPEVYVQINRPIAAGQVIAFSGTAGAFPVKVALAGDSCLAVLNHAYQLSKDSLLLPFQFNRPEDSREAFILPNKGCGISIVSSTGWLDDIQLSTESKQLMIIPGNTGTITIKVTSNLSIQPNQIIQPMKPRVENKRFQFYAVHLIDQQPVTIYWNINVTE